MSPDFETRVLTSLATIEEKLKTIPDHEKRLRIIERVMWTLGGAWLLLSGWVSSHILGAGK